MSIIGIGGGTGTGKTTLAEGIAERMGTTNVAIIQQDSYYLDRSSMPLSDRRKVNFDHPAAFDMNLLIWHVEQLKQGRPIERPVYCYKTHTRLKDTVTVEPVSVVVLEGILVLHPPRLRQLLDLKIYVDAPDDVRFIRRLRRDMQERNRTVDEVIEQYYDTVRPMHLKFIEPTRVYADMVISGDSGVDAAVERVVAGLAVASGRERETHGRTRNS